MSQFHPLRVTDCRKETRDAVVVTFEVPDDRREAFRFVQGQHLTLRSHFDGEEVRRSYSICSAPDEGQIRIAIKRVSDGLFSAWANGELKAGDVIEAMPPSGQFNVPLQPEAARHHIAFAAGSGITPVISIIKATLAAEPRSRFTLFYGNRASSSVIFKSDLADLKDRYLERFNLVFILSREHQDIDLFNGRIDRAKCEALLAHWVAPNDIDVAYVCGPQSMTEQVVAGLEAAGVERQRIKTELFGTAGPVTRRRAPISAEAAAAQEDCAVTLVQDGHTRQFTIRRNRGSVLDEALEQGIELPYSCKGGVCSTCRCKVIEGEVDMDVNFALEDYEVTRGFVLTCQSYPVSERLVLDFDQES
jgi:ring-1,2-phenylacetyl-CoA epoxidase subunit PaaE